MIENLPRQDIAPHIRSMNTDALERSGERLLVEISLEFASKPLFERGATLSVSSHRREEDLTTVRAIWRDLDHSVDSIDSPGLYLQIENGIPSAWIVPRPDGKELNLGKNSVVNLNSDNVWSDLAGYFQAYRRYEDLVAITGKITNEQI